MEHYNGEKLRLSEIPDSVRDSITHNLADYSVGFLRVTRSGHSEHAGLLGSGTFITANRVAAILTAHHVIQALPQRGNLGLILSENLENTMVQMADVRYVRIDRGTVDRDGPDLGAVILSPELASTLKARKSFHNLDRRREQLLKEPPVINDAPWVVHGFVAELTRVETEIGGYEKAFTFYELTGLGGVASFYLVGQYDYVEFPVSYDGRSAIPRDFGGMSGGGLWQIPIAKTTDGQLAPQVPILSGVVFYQEEIQPNQTIVKCHGRRSIYEAAFEAIQSG